MVIIKAMMKNIGIPTPRPTTSPKLSDVSIGLKSKKQQIYV